MFYSKDTKIDLAAAIIPAYNEGKTIGQVLDVVTKTKSIVEIVVIDDASQDNTAEVVKRYQGVRYLKNMSNKGKSYGMQKGVEATLAPILFFCDADLQGLTPEIIERIISPVQAKTVSMFIGIRNNVMQKTIHLFAINSGERALRRELWEKLPEKFKHRFRIEVGLNYIANKYGNGYDSAVLNYYQTIKEKKYGFFKGTILRWLMNIDVGYAWYLVSLDKLKRRIT